MTRTMHDPVDVIGSGCAGAVVSATLTEAGVRVTCLEQGHWWQPGDFPHDRAVDLAGAIDAVDHRINDFGLSGPGYCPPAWHLLGTCRMGDDPETSVIDRWHKSCDCPNLCTIDGSSMVTGAAVNLTSTISALAHRAVGAMVRGRS